MTATSARAFVDRVAAQLHREAEPSTKQWWERYLKGEASFRGVKMATTSRIVREAVWELGLNVDDASVVVETLHACTAQPMTEDKLAGVLLVAEHGLPALDIRHVEALARPLVRGDLADWNSVDWYCVKALGRFVTAGDDAEARARAIANWVHAESLWQRRAGLVSFVDHAAKPEPFEGFTDLLIDTAHTNASDPTRWSQTSVGWVLRELAHQQPERVRRFLDEHPHLSTEARRNALKHL